MNRLQPPNQPPVINSLNQNQPTNVDTMQIPIDSLESIRNRLNQIHLSLRKLSDQINHHNRHPNQVKLPSYSHIQNQFQVLITQLQSVASNLDNNENVLKNTNVYPLPSFPAAQHEGLVTTLLRKKPLPEVDEWIDKAISDVESFNIDIVKDDEFAKWSSSKVQELKEEFQFYGFHLNEELHFLKTEEGKRETQEKQRLQNERDEIERRITDGGKTGLNSNQVLKFMYQGILE